MLHLASKAVFQTLARSTLLKEAATEYGIAGGTGFARRFIAGETIEDAIAAARAVEARGMSHTLDHLGESVRTLSETENATRDYIRIIEKVAEAGLDRNLSLKLTQLGLDVDRAICVDNLRRILAAAERRGFFVRIDMESSQYTTATLEIFELVWKHGSRNVGVVLQSCLYRAGPDLARVNALGARVRLVKGAYREPKDVAYQAKADVDQAYLHLARRLLLEGHYPAIATHDEAILGEVRRFAAEHAIAPDRFEFQMLYGIRRDLQAALSAAGYRMRIYIPFGSEWFPYFMRRLGERPANVWFVVKNLLTER